MLITHRAGAEHPSVYFSIPGVGSATFEGNETKEVSEDLGAQILRNPNFVDESGRNPNFECGACGAETREIAHCGAGVRGELITAPVSMRHEDGKLRCRDCHVAGDAKAADVAPAPAQTLAIASNDDQV